MESSIIPIRDVIFEHRLYLPSAGFFITVVVGTLKGFEGVKGSFHRINALCASRYYIPIILLFTLITTMLSFATYKRNLVWKDEETLWSDVSRKAPMSARGHTNLGLAYYNKGHQERAFEEYLTAVQINPKSSEAQYNLGILYMEKGLTEKAIQSFQIALKYQPKLHQVHNNLGLAYLQKGLMVEAIKEFQAALEIRPYTEAYMNLGTIYTLQGKTEEAIKVYEAALELTPNILEAHYNLGLAYQSRGMLQAARSEFEQVLRIKPNFPQARQALEALRTGR